MPRRLVSPRMRRRTRLVTLNIFVWIFAAAVLALVTVAVLRPEAARQMGEAPPTEGLAPETPMDWLCLPFYVAALALAVGMIVRLRGRPERRPFWVVAALAAAWGLWREWSWDERILGDANTWSWVKYVGSNEVPVWAQVVLGGGSMLVTLAAVVYVVLRAKALAALAAEKGRSISGWLLAGGAGLLALAQALDKYASIDKRLGTNLAAWKTAGWLGYAEESLEAIGPLVLVMGLVMAMLEEPRPD